jgi:rubrerythrin
MPTNAASGSHFCTKRVDGAMTYVSCGGCGVGRPPTGFVAQEVDAPTEEGAWLARMAQLEAASVEAFRALHDDLASHGAPESLLHLVRIAADDEVRHARLAREQAERRGAMVPEVDVRVARGRSLADLAVENAREGCIEETFGAVVARIQADRARDPDLRTMLEAIARDELGHAFLSWRIADWLDRRVADEARTRVRIARAEKLAELKQELPAEVRTALASLAPALA